MGEYVKVAVVKFKHSFCFNMAGTFGRPNLKFSQTKFKIFIDFDTIVFYMSSLISCMCINLYQFSNNTIPDIQ